LLVAMPALITLAVFVFNAVSAADRAPHVAHRSTSSARTSTLRPARPCDDPSRRDKRRSRASP
jgi:hypothetical protein